MLPLSVLASRSRLSFLASSLTPAPAPAPAQSSSPAPPQSRSASAPAARRRRWLRWSWGCTPSAPSASGAVGCPAGCPLFERAMPGALETHKPTPLKTARSRWRGLGGAQGRRDPAAGPGGPCRAGEQGLVARRRRARRRARMQGRWGPAHLLPTKHASRASYVSHRTARPDVAAARVEARHQAGHPGARRAAQRQPRVRGLPWAEEPSVGVCACQGWSAQASSRTDNLQQ
jgi:hypothetical protein